VKASGRLRPALPRAHHGRMRLRLLIAATLAACDNGSSPDCGEPPPGEPFIFDGQLDEATVEMLVDEQYVVDASKLNCFMACDSRYSTENIGFNILSTSVCDLKIDGEMSGDPKAIIGKIHCEGLSSDYVCTSGRRPLGHIEHPLPNNHLPAYLAHCARLEAASVHAFHQLADRLTQWHAPADLIARCRQAAAEESTHAQLLTALTDTPVAPPTQHEVPVDLAAAALDNAIEGCVHEAWSALACAVTARDATTPELRAAYTRLAADEASHAQLAWDLHTWFMGQVTTIQRAAILAAQTSALADLPALARRQFRGAPPALALPDHRAAAHFAAALALAA
jgi:hypothetical protein